MRAHSVVLCVSPALEAGEPPNLFFAGVRTRTHVCGVSVVNYKFVGVEIYNFGLKFVSSEFICKVIFLDNYL